MHLNFVKKFWKPSIIINVCNFGFYPPAEMDGNYRPGTSEC